MKQNFTSPISDLEVIVEESRSSETARDARTTPGGETKRTTETTWRIYVMAYNRLLRETLGKLLAKRNDLQVVGQSAATVETVQELTQSCADLLLLNSGGDVTNDLSIVRMARMHAPRVRIMMLGMNDEPHEFLKCIRGGIAGYVLRDASSQRVLEAVQVVCRGGAFCDGHLCQLLFNYFEKSANSLPSSLVRDSLGLTQREQELVPLLARGASNKEIADQFCLSEQTVKNHLYRMKQKVGAANRLGIVHLCRSHGLNV
jgi:DNA-binding NarL/FixJ family response regulator